MKDESSSACFVRASMWPQVSQFAPTRECFAQRQSLVTNHQSSTFEQSRRSSRPKMYQERAVYGVWNAKKLWNKVE